MGGEFEEDFLMLGVVWMLLVVDFEKEVVYEVGGFGVFDVEMEYGDGGVFVEVVVGFLLSFVVELVVGVFVGECDVVCLILEYVGGFVVGECGFEIDEVIFVGVGYVVVVDGVDDGVLVGVVVFVGMEGFDVEFDFDVKIFMDVVEGVGEIVEGDFGIGVVIGDDYVVVVVVDEFVEVEVFEVIVVGEV